MRTGKCPTNQGPHNFTKLETDERAAPAVHLLVCSYCGEPLEVDGLRGARQNRAPADESPGLEVLWRWLDTDTGVVKEGAYAKRPETEGLLRGKGCSDCDIAIFRLWYRSQLIGGGIAFDPGESLTFKLGRYNVLLRARPIR